MSNITAAYNKQKEFLKKQKEKFNNRKKVFLNNIKLKQEKIMQRKIAGKPQPITLNCQKHICKNCKAEFTGNFCFNCGQAANTSRLTWSSVMNNIFGGITNIANGFGFTILELFTRPGYMINDFIHGKRVIYVKPFQIMFVLAAIYAISNQIIYPDKKEKEKTEITTPINTKDTIAYTKNDFGDNMSEFMIEMQPKINKALENKPFIRAILNILYDWFKTNKALSAILFLPFIALGTKWAFRKSKHNPRFNFVEMLFACCYISCQMLIISIIFLPFKDTDSIQNGIKVIILLWTLKELFRNGKRGTIWKCIVSYIYAYGLIVFLAMLVVFAAVLLFSETV